MILNPSVSGGGGGVETCTGTIQASVKFPANVLVYYDGEQLQSERSITTNLTITVQKNCLVYVSFQGAGGLNVSGDADFFGGGSYPEIWFMYARGDFSVGPG